MKKIINLVALFILLSAITGCANLQEKYNSSSQHIDDDIPVEIENTEEPEVSADTPMDTQADRSENEQEETMRISVKSEEYEIIYELNSSPAASQLYAQLPLTVEVEPFSNNEMTFYPEALSVEDTPLSDGAPGSLSYYAPWGDVVMFYAPCTPNNSLYELGTVVSGEEHIANLSGIITVSAVE